MPIVMNMRWDRVTPEQYEQAREQVGWELFRLMLEVASGRKRTWAEQWKLHNSLVLFNPAPVT